MSLLVPVDSRLRRGATQKLEHTARDVDNNIIDISALTGDAIKWRLATTKGGANVLEKNLDSGIQITDGANGLFEVQISTADSSALTAGVIYYWETFMTIGLDSVPVAIGYIQVLQPIQ